jgi:cytosine/uracil/thiamine/allantoin permease
MTVTGIGPGLVGAVVLLVWIPLMEVDGLAGLSASSAWSLQTVAGGIPARILVVLTGGMGLALAWFTTPETVRMIADLGVSLITPALSIALVDAYLVAEEPYSADKLFRWRSDYGWLNLVGLMSWIVGCGLALWLRPRPAFAPVWLDSMLPSAPTGWPGLFIAGFGAGLAYLSLGKLLRVGRSRRQRMRRF